MFDTKFDTNEHITNFGNAEHRIKTLDKAKGLVLLKGEKYDMSTIEFSKKINTIKRTALDEAKQIFNGENSTIGIQQQQRDFNEIYQKAFKATALVLKDLDAEAIKQKTLVLLENECTTQKPGKEKAIDALAKNTWRGSVLRITDCVLKTFESLFGFSDKYRTLGLKVAAAYRTTETELRENAKRPLTQQEVEEAGLNNPEILPIFKQKIEAFTTGKFDSIIVAPPFTDESLVQIRAIAVKTNQEAIEQLKSYMQQMSNFEVREIIKKQVNLPIKSADYAKRLEEEGHTAVVKVTNTIVPANTYMDEHLGIESTFGAISSEYGVSSQDRRNDHATNLLFDDMISTKVDGTKPTPRGVIRSGVMLGSGAETKAMETVQVAVAYRVSRDIDDLLEKNKGMTEAEALRQIAKRSRQAPLEQNLISVSLLTPDPARGIHDFFVNACQYIKGKFSRADTSERSMLSDQIKALNRLGKKDYLEINVGGETIHVELNPICFNYGVNVGAINFRLGTLKQNSYNQAALKKLAPLVENALSVEKLQMEAGTLSVLQSLWEDIQQLNAGFLSSQTYLKGQNCYEVSTKILALATELDSFHGNTQGATNCMSGKDRTGIEMAAFKALCTVRDDLKRWPTHKELENNTDSIQDRFVQVFIEMLKHDGSLDITALNTTGSVGYKATDMPYPKNKVWESHPVEDFLGFSKTTSA